MTENNNSDATISRQEVKITGIEIPFWDLVATLVWIALASIPAGLIIAVIYAAIAFVLFPMFGTLF